MPSLRGIFDVTDLNSTTKAEEIIAKAAEIPGILKENLCFEAQQLVIDTASLCTRPFESGEFGSDSPIVKSPYMRQVTIPLSYYKLPLGITERAVALAKMNGRVLGLIETQIEQAITAMKINEEQLIAYKTLTDTNLSSFTTLEGSAAHNHTVAASTGGAITMSELAAMKSHIEEHFGKANAFIVGSNVNKAIIKMLMDLGFTSSVSEAALAGSTANPLGVKIIYSQNVPANYGIMVGSTIYSQKPCAFLDVIPTSVVQNQPANGLISAVVRHDYGAIPVIYEGVVVFYIGGTSWTAPSKSLFEFL